MRCELRPVQSGWLELEFVREVIANRFLGRLDHFVTAAERRQTIRLLPNDRTAALTMKNRSIVNHGKFSKESIPHPQCWQL
jgi:hypothetical protein